MSIFKGTRPKRNPIVRVGPAWAASGNKTNHGFQFPFSFSDLLSFHNTINYKHIKLISFHFIAHHLLLQLSFTLILIILSINSTSLRFSGAAVFSAVLRWAFAPSYRLCLYFLQTHVSVWRNWKENPNIASAF